MSAIDADDLPVGVIGLDHDDRVVSCNAWFTGWAGADPVGRPIGDLLMPADDFLEGTGVRSAMMTLIGGDGRTGLVVRAQRAGGAVLTVMDATDRYDAGVRLRQSHGLADRTRTRLELVIDASIAFSAASDEGRLAEILAQTTARAYRAEESVVFLTDPLGVARRVAGENPFEGLPGTSGFAAHALRLREVLRVSGADEGDAVSPLLGDAMRASGVQAVIATPLLHEGEASGLFACFFHHERSFDQEAAPLADALAGQAAQTLVALRLQRQLEHAAMHDGTTGLPNRRALEEHAGRLPAVHRLAVVFVDLDGFKAVNDRLGHALGDDVLREVGRRLEASVRAGDLVARYGGDEFVVVCGAEGDDPPASLAERLRHAIAEPYPFLPVELRLGASIGIAVGDGPSSIDRLIRAADQAMYRAKSEGGNRVA
jgi:diguanylate cyclase (GGDEF)-like protein